MTRGKDLIILTLLMVPLLVAGCVDKKKLDEIRKSQEEISAKINTIEGKINNVEQNQKEMMKFFKPRKPSVDYNKVHNIPIGKSKIRGNEKAPVTIVEFSDFQCPYCSKLQPTLKQVLDAYPDKVRLVFKDFPLSFHKQAMNAARASHAAGEQGKYWEMHDLVFENYNKLTEDMFKEFAEKLKLDITKFTADYKSNKYDNQIQQDMNLGKSIGVSGTPTLFLNGKRMSGRSFNDFKTSIEGYLKKK
jgi:protein-disulfide isomerase